MQREVSNCEMTMNNDKTVVFSTYKPEMVWDIQVEIPFTNGNLVTLSMRGEFWGQTKFKLFSYITRHYWGGWFARSSVWHQKRSSTRSAFVRIEVQLQIQSK